MKSTAGRMQLILLALFTLLSACAAPAGKEDKPETDGGEYENVFPLSRCDNITQLIPQYELFEPLDETITGIVIKEGDFTPEDMDSYCFYDSTVSAMRTRRLSLWRRAKIPASA